ncbi:cytochrome c [Phenylobacterium sp.]|jgi:mono/diheme cytochrome c family protein|uniref:c-type cytochrome n=1 Tax=Phenylobacterium sp. TaxID=1871053 RepID=UPI002E3530A2|nr:cytochrome c [Phenylobacterium sp.]HEX3366643.1 cytochrome c [Phenylobacterium sp.]
MRNARPTLALAALTAIGVLALASAAPGQPAPAAQPPPADKPAIDPGLALMQVKCVTCHDAGFITQVRRPKADWRDLINQMIQRGAEVSDAEADQIQAYLENNFSTPPPSP